MVITENVSGTITLPNGSRYKFSSSALNPESDIISDSLSITWQCCDDSTFALGGAFCAVLSMQIRIPNTSSYAIIGAKIEINMSVSDGSDSDKRAGVFTVTSASRYEDIYTLSASDNMIWLDQSSYAEGDNNRMQNSVVNKFVGRIYNPADAFVIISRDICKLPTQASSEIRATMCNCDGSLEYNDKDFAKNVTLLEEDTAQNLRDYVGWLAEWMGGFAYADDNGAISVKRFSNTSNYTLERKNCSNMDIADFSFYNYQTRFTVYDNSYFAVGGAETTEIGKYNIMTEISENPFLDGIYKTAIADARRDIGLLHPPSVSLHKMIGALKVRPFTATCYVPHYFRLGDCITINNSDTVITKVQWKYRGGQTISCAGKDTRILSSIKRQSPVRRSADRLKTSQKRLEKEMNTQIGNINTDIIDISDKIGGMDTNINNISTKYDDLKSQIDDLWNALNGGE